LGRGHNRGDFGDEPVALSPDGLDDPAGRASVSMALVMPRRTMSTLAISMISHEAGSVHVVSISMTRITDAAFL
jgi:hypothetical protein